MQVDDLAQEIRRVDGNHSLGAGALAKALMPFITAYLSARSAADIGALVAGITDENRHGEMWGVRVPTSRQEATAMQIVAERWFAENGGSPARSAEPVAWMDEWGELSHSKPPINPQPLYAHPTPETFDG